MHPFDSEMWKTEPDIVRRFFEFFPRYEDLCDEVSTIIRKSLKSAAIEVAYISSRAKTLPSFIRKYKRDHPDDPFREFTDFAGARVAYLYKSDSANVESVLRNVFNVVEKQDKVQEMGSNTFGYGAVHFLVSLKESSSGIRFAELKDLVCEVQCRTLGQDAWAIVSRHLFYERGDDVPDEILRKLNRLAAIFEEADEQFDQVKADRKSYIDGVHTLIGRSDMSSASLNLDSMIAYLGKRYNASTSAIDKHYLSAILNSLDRSRYRTVEDIARVMDVADGMLAKYISELGASELNPSDRLALSLGIVDEECRKSDWGYGWDSATIARLRSLGDSI